MISHKLNEIERSPTTITIIRDGRTIETLAVAADAVDEDRIIRGMVGRDLEHRFPDARAATIGEVVLRGRGLDGARTRIDATGWSSTTPTSTSARARSSASPGLMGAGRTELAMSVFGRSYGSNVAGRLIMDGKEIARCARCTRRSTPASPTLTEDRKRYGLNLIEDIKRNDLRRPAWASCRKGLRSTSNEEIVVAEEYRTQHEHQDARA